MPIPIVFSVVALLILVSAGVPPAGAASDPEAVGVARRTLEAMGGAEAWEQTRYLSWDFFGRRQHYWDRYTGRVRIETDDLLVLMNVQTREGRAFADGQELAGDALVSALERGYGMWVNDSYWAFMPYKLLDPGVHLAHLGPGQSEDGRSARVIAVTFEGVGLTPQNRYHVWVDDASGLVSQWSFYRSADDEEPGFVLPWNAWRRVGRIMLCTDHGRGMDWNLQVHDELPAAVFERPDPVELE